MTMTMTSGLNRPRPTAAGRSICSSLISRVFGVSPLCIPNRRPTAPCLLPNLGSFAGPGVVCTATPISNTQSQVCEAHTILEFRAILGLWYPLGTLWNFPGNPGIETIRSPTTQRHLQSQDGRAAIPIPGFCNPRKRQFRPQTPTSFSLGPKITCRFRQRGNFADVKAGLALFPGYFRGDVKFPG